VKVDAVEERPGHLRLIIGGAARRAAAGERGIAEMAAAAGFIAATSWTRAGKVTWVLARATLTLPVSSGCRSESSTGRWNSGSSSRNNTPRCARLISPGLTRSPPPTRAGMDAL